MVAVALVDRYIEAGRRLLNALDAAHVDVDVALWLFEEERDSWKLVLSSKQLTDLGPLQAYKAIGAVLDGLNLRDISLADITVQRVDRPLIKALRAYPLVDPWILDKQLGWRWINGVRIDDAYIYRVR
jgi:hypothetical protein